MFPANSARSPKEQNYNYNHRLAQDASSHGALWPKAAPATHSMSSTSRLSDAVRSQMTSAMKPMTVLTTTERVASQLRKNREGVDGYRS